jgi:hypothetical protein
MKVSTRFWELFTPEQANKFMDLFTKQIYITVAVLALLLLGRPQFALPPLFFSIMIYLITHISFRKWKKEHASQK